MVVRYNDGRFLLLRFGITADRGQEAGRWYGREIIVRRVSEVADILIGSIG